MKALSRQERFFLATIDPIWVMRQAGLKPDPWQRSLGRCHDTRVVVLIARQCGKSTVAAAKAVTALLAYENSPVIIVAPSERQSGETLRYAKRFLSYLTDIAEVKFETQSKLELSNGSRLLALPGKPGTIRGFGNVKLLIMDEDAQIDDELYGTIEPMITNDGQIIRMSTPFGKRGGFYHCWSESSWTKFKVTAPEVPRKYPKEVIEAKRSDPMIGWRMFKQEYMCEFVDTVDAVFTTDVIDLALDDSLTPVFMPAMGA